MSRATVHSGAQDLNMIDRSICIIDFLLRPSLASRSPNEQQVSAALLGGVVEEPLEECHIRLVLQLAMDPQNEAAQDIKLLRKESNSPNSGQEPK
ncbi:hypothetical protein LTR10_013163 [Elasticomyces elasticus]|uniref:Uncharacterized protein n=1 Tax=Exophiala sideris TaxID=1016849 RepID=A0ABR0JB09_9EURO|nr:hypothetical protein LTR10_013163 [Elasticomyces elasticus]KAK5030538.1 hypothetical protein LTS07_005322 [Exophiala sideris]KAK5038592.1 hypothetical protein LTR13_004339 [Exophiala sideris]KAK5060473.1 hypothetical protein LTR69_005790 [Exophiala sideris]KAK5183385.1 hypothetical protein LTR44_004386 [Eurotiomycetes sp. CCFEE 6388]